MKGGLLGAHTSAAGGVGNALREAFKIGATCCQLFTSNQRKWEGQVYSEALVEDWFEALEKTQLTAIMSHGSYLINLASPRPEVEEKSIVALVEEWNRCRRLTISRLNIHPGACLSDPVEVGLARIVKNLEIAHQKVNRQHSGSDPLLLLESTAGQGSNLGAKLEELAFIIDHLKEKIDIGICIDTCHLFAAGFPLKNEEDLENLLTLFDKIIGLKWLKAIHVNDSLTECGSKVDRHANLGEGKIGKAFFEALMRSKRCQEIPKYLETPGGPLIWEQEIDWLRSVSL